MKAPESAQFPSHLDLCGGPPVSSRWRRPCRTWQTYVGLQESASWPTHVGPRCWAAPPTPCTSWWSWRGFGSPEPSTSPAHYCTSGALYKAGCHAHPWDISRPSETQPAAHLTPQTSPSGRRSGGRQLPEQESPVSVGLWRRSEVWSPKAVSHFLSQNLGSS